MQALIKKTIASRKFWAAVTAAIPFAMEEQWVPFALVLMTYAGILGAKEALESLPTKVGGSDVK